MQNSERTPSTYEIPAGDYSASTPEVARPAENNDNIVSFEERLAQARAQVNDSYYSARPKIEQVDESVLQIISLRGQELDEARERHLAANPYKYPIHGQPVLRQVINIAKNSLYEKKTKGDLIDEESEIGASIFQIEGLRFFNTHPSDWWAHHSRPDLPETTTHFQAQKKGILKCSSDILVPNQFISGAELENFEKATEIYHRLVIERYNYRSRLINRDENSNKKAA